MILTPGSDNKIHSATVEEIEALSSQMVSLDYTNVNLHDVLRAFANSYNLNIVLTKDIAGKVSAQLKDQSVDDALDAILAVNNYGFVRKGNIIYVMPKADMD
jgi:type IV pilus assembly protein PilQ